jgi:DTW domain-containing protein YfiP
MHPKEFKKTKNGTGHFTHLSLPNSELFMGIDFSDNDRIITPLKNKLKNQLAYRTFGCLKKLATF